MDRVVQKNSCLNSGAVEVFGIAWCHLDQSWRSSGNSLAQCNCLTYLIGHQEVPGPSGHQIGGPLGGLETPHETSQISRILRNIDQV